MLASNGFSVIASNSIAKKSAYCFFVGLSVHTSASSKIDIMNASNVICTAAAAAADTMNTNKASDHATWFMLPRHRNLPAERANHRTPLPRLSHPRPCRSTQTFPLNPDLRFHPRCDPTTSVKSTNQTTDEYLPNRSSSSSSSRKRSGRRSLTLDVSPRALHPRTPPGRAHRSRRRHTSLWPWCYVVRGTTRRVTMNVIQYVAAVLSRAINGLANMSGPGGE